MAVNPNSDLNSGVVRSSKVHESSESASKKTSKKSSLTKMAARISHAVDSSSFFQKVKNFGLRKADAMKHLLNNPIKIFFGSSPPRSGKTDPKDEQFTEEATKRVKSQKKLTKAKVKALAAKEKAVVELKNQMGELLEGPLVGTARGDLRAYNGATELLLQQNSETLEAFKKKHPTIMKQYENLKIAADQELTKEKNAVKSRGYQQESVEHHRHLAPPKTKTT
jgi:hypothetical protein